MSVISYRPQMAKAELEKIVLKRLKYKNLNSFLNHAVSKTLKDEMGSHPIAQKMVAEMEDLVLKYFPLTFRKTTKREHREIMADVHDMKTGKVKSHRMKPIMGK